MSDIVKTIEKIIEASRSSQISRHPVNGSGAAWVPTRASESKTRVTAALDPDIGSMRPTRTPSDAAQLGGRPSKVVVRAEPLPRAPIFETPVSGFESDAHE